MFACMNFNFLTKVVQPNSTLPLTNPASFYDFHLLFKILAFNGVDLVIVFLFSQ